MASKSGSGGLREPPNEQAVLNYYESMRSELSQIYSNITELEMQVSEHSLVINAIQPLDQSRKCFRMIGGVLVERTIKEVLPAVQRNKDGLEEVVKKLYKTLEKKKNELTEFEAKYKIRIRKQDDNKEEGNKKEAITVEDIENFLHESLLLSFNTEIEDGSIEEVAEQLIILHEEHLRGSH